MPSTSKIPQFGLRAHQTSLRSELGNCSVSLHRVMAAKKQREKISLPYQVKHPNQTINLISRSRPAHPTKLLSNKQRVSLPCLSCQGVKRSKECSDKEFTSGNKQGVVSLEIRSKWTDGNVRGCQCRAFKTLEIECERGQMRRRSPKRFVQKTNTY